MNITKKTIFLVAFMATAVAACAQDNRPTFEDYLKARQQGFNQYQQQKENDFDAFRRQANAQFAAKMAEAWQRVGMEPPMPNPAEPDPVSPLVRDNEPTIPNIPIIPGGTITPIPVEPDKPRPKPQPVPVQPQEPQGNWFGFSFYGTSCKVRLDHRLDFKLNKIDEKSVAAVWQQLSGEASDALVADCYRLIEEMNLCDWAAIKLFKAIGDAYYGKGSNEATLMQMYLLTQTGFKARIGRTEKSLVVLVPFDGTVYGMSFYRRDGEAFFDITENQSEKGCLIFQEAFPNERIPSLRPKMPILAENLTEGRTYKSEKYPEMSVQIRQNRNLMAFLDGYPQCSHENYVYAGLSERTKQAVYPMLRKALEGKSISDAANMLLNFMHTAFDYQSDGQQFGYERPFFGDESFWFPYNDCEDRAILYSILVKELLDIDAVLLAYPGHMATAIALPEIVNGAYFEMNGKRYLFCDPTYIGSSIGMMPKRYGDLQPEVIIIK